MVDPNTSAPPSDETQKSPAAQAEGQPSTENEKLKHAEGCKEGQPCVDGCEIHAAVMEKEALLNKEPPAEDPPAASEKEKVEDPPPSDPPPAEDPPPATTQGPGPVNTSPPPNYPDCFIKVKFQERPTKEAGVNGCHVEDVLRVAYKKLAEFQAGPFRCQENDKALSYIENAIKWQERRMSLRKMQHVEGTNMPHNSTT